MRRTIVLAAGLVLFAGEPRAFAWGCEGHQAVALIAERLLNPPTLKAIEAVLAASPVDPALKPFCPPVPADPIADVSTWADDYRTAVPATAGWHFINFPLAIGPNTASYRKYCPMGNCAIDAIVAQYRILTTTADARMRAEALRFLVHFVGDLHQPLHTATNGDRGGNCLPVTYFGEPPVEDDRQNFRPNLHGVWDDSTIRRLMSTRGLAGSRALADYIAGTSPLPFVAAQTPTAARVTSWARDADVLARTVAYGRLPVTPPIEPAGALS